LKEKYAANLIANWKESSDAEKSVHEDLGIAAYLSCLWQGKTTSFVDLGCGNGLLVFILTSEVSRKFLQNIFYNAVDPA
jgi:tRNASer (uridine44-2'-O)-methyltransferase